MAPSERIHILGVGTIGALAAHLLSESALNLDITLVLHRASLLDDYVRQGDRLTIRRNDGSVEHSSGYDLEYPSNDGSGGGWLERRHGDPSRASRKTDDTIRNLLLCCKTTQTLTALEPLKHRLGPGSTVAFLQNGCGVIDEVNEKIFPDPARRPRYVVGVVYHGGNQKAPFDVNYTASKSLLLGTMPQSASDQSGMPQTGDEKSAPAAIDAEPCFLIRACQSAPRLNALVYPYVEILQKQLVKLAINAFCNAVTANENVDNTYLLTVPSEYRQLVCREISAVYLKMPELQGVDGIERIVGWKALDANLLEHINKFPTGVTSMCWDLRNGKKTEIRYINGYISKRGRELGLETTQMDYLLRSVEAKGG